MLTVNSKNINIYDIDTDYMTFMTREPKVYIDINRLEFLLNFDEANLAGIAEIIRRYVLISREYPLGDIKKSNLLNFLIKDEGIPEDLFLEEGPKGLELAFNADVRKRIVDKKYSIFFMEILEHYMDTKSFFSKAYPCRTFVKNTGLKTNHDTPLGVIPFRYRKSVTSRIYTSDYSFQGLPNKYKEIIAAPKDYFLLWADFSQIDLRVMFNMFYANDTELRKYIDSCKDYYQAIAMAAAKRAGQTFNEKLFLEERPKYKQKILSVFYGASYMTLCDLNQDLAKNLYRYITTNPKYIAYRETIQQNINSRLGFDIKTYFNREILKCPDSKDAVRACLNAPIQATSADIMQIFAVKLMEEFKQICNNKFSEPLHNLINIMLNRHDEAVFCIHKKLIPYINVFKEYSKIQIDNWAPLDLHWSAGYNYGEDNEELIQQLSYSTYKPSLNNMEIYPNSFSEYHPIREIVKGALVGTTYNNEVIYCISIYSKNKLYILRTSINQNSKKNLLSMFRQAINKGWNFGSDIPFRVILDTNVRENQFIQTIDNVEFVCTYQTNSVTVNICKERLNAVLESMEGNSTLLQAIKEEVIRIG